VSRPAVAGVLTVALTVAAVAGSAARSTSSGASVNPGRAPLTGRLDPSGATRGHGALAVKIENTPEARPQAGLDEADVVYEEVVEGGITRFWAVFDSRIPPAVGPIRSVRALDPDLVAPLHAVVAYSGGTAPNVAAIRASTSTWVDETNAGPAFYRSADRQAPHNLYAHAPRLLARGASGAPPPLFSYSTVEPAPGTPVRAVTLGFAPPYDVTYTYAPTTRTWVRSYHGVAHRAASGSVVAPTNVIVQFVNYTSGGAAQLLGDTPTQAAWVFTAGRLVEGRWSKPNAATPTRFTDRTGAPIGLHPGATWVELIPIGVTVPIDPGA
jgi:Protein of unknown function (DUF3048) N-terminal domain/Protein of unknown function (DUF3048) C-terminal domain